METKAPKGAKIINTDATLIGGHDGYGQLADAQASCERSEAGVQGLQALAPQT